jgi:hypothetical protein
MAVFYALRPPRHLTECVCRNEVDWPEFPCGSRPNRVSTVRTCHTSYCAEFRHQDYDRWLFLPARKQVLRETGDELLQVRIKSFTDSQ